MSDLDLNELGQKVAHALEKRTGDEKMLAKVKARLHHAVGEKRVPERRVWFAFGGGAALAAVAAGLIAVVVWPREQAPLTFTGSSDFVSARVDDQPLKFSDGSEVVVRKGSQLRVSQLRANGATAALERGSAHVSVIHRDDTKWTFTAGPYLVHVIGTKFELSWNPDTTGLQVEMEEGTVEVVGPGMSKQRVSGTGKLELFADADAETEAELPGSEPVAARPRRHPKQAPKAEAPVVAAAGTPTWRYLADTGDAAAAMVAAESAGYSQLAGSLVQQDVLFLGDTARKAGKRARAMEAYNAVRARFPGSPAAIEAAMRMGGLFSGDDVTAAKWFERGFKEGPNAPSAVEAMGRWLDALSRTDRSGAKRVAADYLREFPNGPYAQLARDVLR